MNAIHVRVALEWYRGSLSLRRLLGHGFELQTHRQYGLNTTEGVLVFCILPYTYKVELFPKAAQVFLSFCGTYAT
jgi:hypothetical protein